MNGDDLTIHVVALRKPGPRDVRQVVTRDPQGPISRKYITVIASAGLLRLSKPAPVLRLTRKPASVGAPI